MLALHRAFAIPDQRVLVISAGEDASRRLLAEAATVAMRSRLLAGSVVDENAGLLVLSNGSEVRSVPASERAIRGWTVDLLLIDECAQVDDDLLLGAAIPTTAARPDARIVLAGSPGAAEGAFYVFAEQGESGSEHVSTFTWRLVDAEWIESDVIAAARESLAPAQFAREFEGRFADVGAEERVIPREWIEQAQRHTLEPGGLVFGVDIARHGGDESVAVAVRGGVARVEWATKGNDLMVTAGRVVAMARDARGPEPPIFLDAIGMGYAVLDRCRELGVGVQPFIASARAAQSERYLNLRAEAWWGAREAFRLGEVDLPAEDRVLAAQLGAQRYRIASNGAVQIAEKGSMRSSPDRADALVIALYARQSLGLSRQLAAMAEQARTAPLDPLMRAAEGLPKGQRDLSSDLLDRDF